MGLVDGFGLVVDGALDGSADAIAAETDLPEPVSALMAPLLSGEFREATLVADFDGDGFPDLLRFDGREIRGEDEDDGRDDGGSDHERRVQGRFVCEHEPASVVRSPGRHIAPGRA